MNGRLRIRDLVSWALECSIYVNPKSPGLTNDEIHEVARQLEFKPGEIGDALSGIARCLRGSKYQPDGDQVPRNFFSGPNPDYRNPKAFEFVYTQLRENQREVGAANAGVARSVLVASGVATGLLERDLGRSV